tara:strand:- start:568 stop:945 length:378 start_codon:yes stop_codon:yes gene_type:complete
MVVLLLLRSALEERGAVRANALNAIFGELLSEECDAVLRNLEQRAQDGVRARGTTARASDLDEDIVRQLTLSQDVREERGRLQEMIERSIKAKDDEDQHLLHCSHAIAKRSRLGDEGIYLFHWIV